jgi:Iron-containing outer mitochondrial membrane protein N-terminus
MVIQSFADVAKVIGTYWLALIVLIGGVALLGYAGEKFFGFLPTRVRRVLSNVGYYLMAGLVLWFVVGSVIGCFVDLPGAHRGPREGEPCGPGYRWTRVGPAVDPDLSCEAE